MKENKKIFKFTSKCKYLLCLSSFFFFNQLVGQNIQAKFCQVAPSCNNSNTVAIELKIRDANNTGANADQVEFVFSYDNSCLANPILCSSFMNAGTLLNGSNPNELSYSYNNTGGAYPALTEAWQTIAIIEFDSPICDLNTPHLEWINADVYSAGTPYGAVEKFDIKPWNLDLRVFLQGAMDDPINPSDLTGMRTQLSNMPMSAGGNLIPLINPYSIAPWNMPTINAPSIPTNVVDWIIIHLRELEMVPYGAYDHSFVAFLSDDGQVISLDGNPLLITPFSISGEYRIIIEHRNHLPIISSTLVGDYSSNSLLEPIHVSHDFTTDSSTMWANPLNECQILLDNGTQTIYAMRAGNSLQFTPSRSDINANDTQPVLNSFLTFSTYDAADFNMDGRIDTYDWSILITNYLHFTGILFN